MGFTHRGGGGEESISSHRPPAYGSYVPEPVHHGEPVPAAVTWLFRTSRRVLSSSLTLPQRGDLQRILLGKVILTKPPQKITAEAVCRNPACYLLLGHGMGWLQGHHASGTGRPLQVYHTKTA